ncbi:MAG: CPBP family intramembrane metalloprotease [Rhodobacteraceae bacterium]|nr:CPBP family intramembrane metalloprotease [Paracoccaceae bacterium]
MRDDRVYAAQAERLNSIGSRTELWRLFVAFVIVMMASFGLGAVLSAVLERTMSPGWVADLQQGKTAGALLVLLFSFAFVTIGVHLAARILQGRGLPDIVGPASQTVRQFIRVLFFLVILTIALMVLPPYSFGEPLEINMPLSRWVMLLPVSLAALLVQTSAEEVLFRGYIQQALAVRFRSRWVFLLVPSALFALGHYQPAMAEENAGLIALWAGVFGVLMADLTARAGTLGPAIAMHFFNNLTAVVIVASPSSLNGLALYLLPYELSDGQALRPWLAVDFALMLVGWLVARLAIRR